MLTESECKGTGSPVGRWGDFFPFFQNLRLCAQKFLDCVRSSVKDSRRDTVRCPELPTEGLVVYETDESVVKGCEIARECEELSIAERLEVILDYLKQEFF